MRPDSRALRRAGVGAALLASVLALSACRTSPGVAAYVGDATITMTELDRAVERGLSNEAVAARYDGAEADYRRLVLQDLITADVYDSAALQYGIEASDSEIDSRLNDVLQANGQTEADFYAGQATDGQTEADIRQRIRQFILGEKLAEEAGLDDASSEAALRALYEQTGAQAATFDVGLITVPDQPTADTVLARLTADPGTYVALYEQYPNINTVEQQTVQAAQLTSLVPDPSTLAAGVGQTVPLPSGEIGVLYIFDVIVPTFEELRPTLEQQTGEQVQAAVTQEIASIRGDLDISVNPRFGTLGEDGTLIDDDRGVVTVIDGDEPVAETGLN
ncbi:MAG: SurA N-terminal domain-containing protein [Geodermatophilaceae bacterium]|nr:SurA N-terminal domain-containing protein [Geodermatophilaceae bacterium]